MVPILPALALSLVTPRLAKPPFANNFITFSAQPEFVELDPSKGLASTVEHMSNAAWGMNTDLHAVFVKLILPLAIKHKVKQEDMIKRLFVFSDMQFDAAFSGEPSVDEWNTNHDESSNRLIRRLGMRFLKLFIGTFLHSGSVLVFP